MIVKPNDYLMDALHNQYAIGAFNTSNLELTQAIIKAAAKLNSAVIVQTSEGAIDYAGIDVMAGMVKEVAQEYKVPVILNLDHGKTFKSAQQCIDAGYTSVMIDASKETFEENVELTKEVTAMAHARGVWVEAELGAILGAEGAKELDGDQTPDDFMTNPKQVYEFIERTGVDALAVSVGTIHGAFSGQEYIRFELLEEIEKIIPDLPLVVHGASGIAMDHLQRVATQNVCKINVDTEMRIAFEAAVKSYFDVTHDKLDPRKILGPARDAVQDVVEGKIEAFGSNGKAEI
jgi:fructose-bisphosphate aldolase, class II